MCLGVRSPGPPLRLGRGEPQHKEKGCVLPSAHSPSLHPHQAGVVSHPCESHLSFLDVVQKSWLGMLCLECLERGEASGMWENLHRRSSVKYKTTRSSLQCQTCASKEHVLTLAPLFSVTHCLSHFPGTKCLTPAS